MLFLVNRFCSEVNILKSFSLLLFGHFRLNFVLISFVLANSNAAKPPNYHARVIFGFNWGVDDIALD